MRTFMIDSSNNITVIASEEQAKSLVKERTFNRFTLTGQGWIRALQITNTFDSPELKVSAGKLAAALKMRVDDRRTDGLVTRAELEAETGLADGFIYNAIDSHLLYHLFRRRDAGWAPDDEMHTCIEVPLDFGLPID